MVFFFVDEELRCTCSSADMGLRFRLQHTFQERYGDGAVNPLLIMASAVSQSSVGAGYRACACGWCRGLNEVEDLESFKGEVNVTGGGDRYHV
nr:protein kinase-like domain, phloem protein 2-like protein [Tanacetum cinerariifolium]